MDPITRFLEVGVWPKGISIAQPDCVTRLLSFVRRAASPRPSSSLSVLLVGMYNGGLSKVGLRWPDPQVSLYAPRG